MSSNKVSPAWNKAGGETNSDDHPDAIDPNREPFFTTPWWAPGHRIRGMDQTKLFVNENAVRARAGLLMAFAFVVITLLNSLDDPSKVVPYMAIPALLDFISGCIIGLTPLAPYGIVGTLLVRGQKPHWKPYGPKRFAWFLGILMVLTCLTFVLATDKSLRHRKYYMVGIASVCVILTYLESAVGFCLGCYMFNKIAPKLGWEQCKECTADSLISKDGVEATVPELQALVGGHDAVVFSKTKCPFCVRAKSALRAEGVGFHVVELDSPEGSKWVPTLMKATGQRTVPYVYLQADFIGGATDLEALVTNGKLKERFVSPV